MRRTRCRFTRVRGTLPVRGDTPKGAKSPGVDRKYAALIYTPCFPVKAEDEEDLCGAAASALTLQRLKRRAATGGPAKRPKLELADAKAEAEPDAAVVESDPGSAKPPASPAARSVKTESPSPVPTTARGSCKEFWWQSSPADPRQDASAPMPLPATAPSAVPASWLGHGAAPAQSPAVLAAPSPAHIGQATEAGVDQTLAFYAAFTERRLALANAASAPQDVETKPAARNEANGSTQASAQAKTKRKGKAKGKGKAKAKASTKAKAKASPKAKAKAKPKVRILPPTRLGRCDVRWPIACTRALVERPVRIFGGPDYDLMVGCPNYKQCGGSLKPWPAHVPPPGFLVRRYKIVR